MRAVDKATAYLEQEVRLWRPDNGCYSCHNNGDGARALFAAGRTEALGDTLSFLSNPRAWQGRGQERGSAALSTVQFASALMVASGDERLIAEAAGRVAAAQQPDGHWMLDEEQGPGSAVTYGPFLGTYMAREILRSVPGGRYRSAIARADAWLSQTSPRHIIDQAAVALALGRQQDAARLLALQAASGSWNGEVFDTAVAMLALAGRSGEESRRAVSRARDFLIASQLEPGGWPGTTRPPGGQSYAQHISTTAWALLALKALQP
ncbi:MAG: hypothetical protein R2762_06755 [Bryobacteraceae bacterium]